MNTYIVICKSVQSRPMIIHGDTLNEAIDKVPILALYKEEIDIYISIAGTPDIGMSMNDPFDPINILLP